jgi:hypothetical protein
LSEEPKEAAEVLDPTEEERRPTEEARPTEERKAYRRPQLRHLGSVRELTLGSTMGQDP